jgi:hypothetical protein
LEACWEIHRPVLLLLLRRLVLLQQLLLQMQTGRVLQMWMQLLHLCRVVGVVSVRR